MTNAEKYLKDEKYIFDIAKGIAEAICYDDMEHSKKITEKEIRNWLTSNTKPTLTEDERVILRNIDKQYDKVGRKISGALYLRFAPQEYGDKGNIDSTFEDFFGDHLFQFIKERRRI